MLPGLEWAGYLSREERVVHGKVCKNYAITEAGRDALIEASAKIRDMVGEVMDRQGTVALPDPDEADGGNDA